MDGAMSTLMELTVVLVVCPALLAAWLDNRYPWLRPREMRRIAIHIGLGGLLAFVVLRPLLLAVGALLDGAVMQATSFAVACTIITYGLVVSLWAMRNMAELARTQR
jgi:protein-S-isoprenylcysteine O-methyltransferase Ste14